jgi:hypothetical protein
MRLLHVDMRSLYEFFSLEILLYAILSHCWAQDEVRYKEVCKGQNLGSRGWQKMQLLRFSSKESSECQICLDRHMLYPGRLAALTIPAERFLRPPFGPSLLHGASSYVP